MINLWNDRNWSPMLLEEVFKPFDSPKYLFELKFDGIRAIVFASPNEVKVFSRNNFDITYLYPELENIKYLVKRNTIFDGEIISIENGVPSFSKLQKRIHLKNKAKIKYEMRKNPVIFMCYDVLYDNKNLINKSLLERKKVLDKYPPSDCFLKSKYVVGEGIKLFKFVKEHNIEGIVAKKTDSLYEINKRSDSWIKIKNFKEGEFYIGGYIEKESNYMISILLGEYRDSKLYYVSKVSLGKKARLYKEIKSEKVVLNSPFYDYKENNINYVIPRLKCKVKFIERTINNHLRHPFINE